MLFFQVGFSQVNEEQKELQIERIIESIAGSEEEDVNDSVILEEITSNAEHQININLATEEDLEQLNMLDFRQIQNILQYRKQYGFIVSGSELSALEGFTPEIVSSLTPFMVFKAPPDSTGSPGKKLYQKAMIKAKTTFPRAKGYSAVSKSKGAVYPGLPVSFYTRYHLEIPKKMELGLICDNDAGEPFFMGSNKMGFDYYSGFISLKGKTFIRQVTLGDYLLRFGQGVSFGSASGLGKSSNALNVLKYGQALKPYISADENRFFRGISTMMASGPFTMVFFYSNKNRDANIMADPATGQQRYFTSLQTSGYHRTSNEAEDEKSVNEQLAGGYGELKFSRLRFGALFAYQHFGLPMSTGSSAYKAKSFSGRDNLNFGADYQLALSHLQFFGEAGLSKSGKPGVVQGLIWNVHPQFSWSSFFRYFDPGFHNFYGSSLSEGSGNRNETGLYTGMMIYPFPKVKISCYADFYHFPWVTYSTVAPSGGRDYMTQIDLALSRKLSLYFKGKFESKPQKKTGNSGVSADYDEIITRLRLHSEYVVNEHLTFRSRFEYAGYAFDKVYEKGILFFQDVVIAPARQIKMWLRYAWFNTDGYNSRIYTYENDLLYNFSIPEFHGNGHRFYVNLKYSPSWRVNIYLKAGCTIHNGVSSWSSGNDLTAGNKRIEISGLLYFRF